MVWFSEDVLSVDMIFHNYMAKLKQIPLEGEEDGFSREKQADEISPTLKVQRDVAALLMPFFGPDGLVAKCLEFAATQVGIYSFITKQTYVLLSLKRVYMDNNKLYAMLDI